jgi:Uncharacterized protein conserved in bacteria
MILDTSAIVAALANEPDGALFRAAMLGAESLAISAITVSETRMVLYCRVVDAFDEMPENVGFLWCRSTESWQQSHSMRSENLEKAKAIPPN